MLRTLVRDCRQCLPVIGALAFDLPAQALDLLACLFPFTLSFKVGILDLLTKHLNFDFQSTVLIVF
ncbi:MAG: hypothetical protein CMF73_08075 [Maricaulis sp.]|nr:hypothetical protein [Maricaulis sp.]